MNIDIYEQWKKKYYKEKIVDYSKYFNDKDIQILHKLEVYINISQIYTEYEHEIFEMKLIEYYEDAEYVDGTKIPPTRNVDNYNVTREDYSRILDIMYKISLDYNF